MCIYIFIYIYISVYKQPLILAFFTCKIILNILTYTKWHIFKQWI